MKKLNAILSILVGSLVFTPISICQACPAINALPNFVASNLVGASYSIVPGTLIPLTDDVVNYTLNSLVNTFPNAATGIPGVIEYCVYTPTLPTSAAATAIGADGTSFVASFHTAQGYFEFSRSTGNPSNVLLDGLIHPMGTANWPQGTAPTQQTILIHINDAAECDALYHTNPGTCFVLPGNTPPPPPLCNGNPACKQVVIDEAITTSPLTVPAFTQLHIHYLYVIVNQPSNTFNMIFYAPTPKTQDINSGGGKDYFGCEQIPDPSGQPGAFGLFPNYQGKGWNMNFTQTKGTCNQSRLTFTSPAPGPIVLMPGQSVSWTVDMVTRKNASGKYEYTSTGSKFLNSGFTVKWFQSNDNLLHSFATAPITVNAVSP